jgi:PKD repeat protein
MGVSYNANVSQWDKGEYTGSNNGGPSANYGNGPDDIAVIASLTNGNGFGYRADDHGDSNGGATVLAPSGLDLSGEGLIERADDVDVFSFTTGAGVITLNVQPYLRQPNLDVLAQLYDGGNNLVASSNPASSVSASFNLSLAAGTYYLQVDGTGTGNPFANPPTGYTDYGSIGQYTISGTIVDPGGNQAPVAVAAASPTSGSAPLIVNFDGSGSSDDDGTIISYSWDFGDDSSGVGASVSHQYDGPGSFEATLTVTDDGGFSSSDSVTITVIEPPPAAPAALEVSASSESQIDLVWIDMAANEIGFQIERRDADAGTNFAQIALVAANVESYNDTGLAASTNYEYRLRAYNGTGYSGYSNTAGAATHDPPPFVDLVASSETMVAGTIAAGSFADTWTDDGNAEELRERESGGKPARRHSYLEHKWRIDVPAGGSARTFYANAWAPANSENDRFVLAYSTDDVNYVDMFMVSTATDDQNIYQSFSLPEGLSGTVYVRVVDSDQSQGNRTLDKVSVDHLYIRKENAQGVPPVAPSVLTATAVGSSQIDLTWIDNSSDEYGFYIERRTVGTNFSRVAEVATDVSGFSDSGLNPGTTYTYQVQAYNGAGASSYTSPADATTDQAPLIYVADMDDASTPAPRNRWDATSRIRVTLADGTAPVAGVTVFGVWGDWASGAGECTTGSDGWCEVTKGNLKSRVTSVSFTVTGATGPGFLYDGSLADPDGDSSNGAITLYIPV